MGKKNKPMSPKAHVHANHYTDIMASERRDVAHNLLSTQIECLVAWNGQNEQGCKASCNTNTHASLFAPMIRRFLRRSLHAPQLGGRLYKQ